MNVLFICHEASRTGAPLVLLQELRYIKNHCKDISFELLVLKKGELLESFKELCYVHLGWSDNSLKTRILRKFCKRQIDFPYLYVFKKGQFDVIYANTIVSFKVAIELKKKYDVPLIGHVHESENAFCTFDLTKEKIDEFDKLIAVSNLTKKNLMDIFNIPDSKIVIQHPISPWIDDSIKNKIEISPINLSPGKYVMGIFCSGNWWKATEMIPLVVRCFYERYQLSDCEFYVVGHIDNITRYHLEYDLKKMNVKRKIHWVGEVDEPLKYHARFDVFLLLSREDSNPLAAQESAFMGKPVIGFEDVTGAAEWICKGAGSLVPYMDFNRMSDEIYKYYVNDKLRKEVGNKAKEIVTKMYLNDSKMSNIIDLIREYK